MVSRASPSSPAAAGPPVADGPRTGHSGAAVACTRALRGKRAPGGADEPCKSHGTAFAAAISECSDVTFDSPGIDCRRERLELCPLPMTLPPRTSSEPCFVSRGDSLASTAAKFKNREWRHMIMQNAEDLIPLKQNKIIATTVRSGAAPPAQRRRGRAGDIRRGSRRLKLARRQSVGTRPRGQGRDQRG